MNRGAVGGVNMPQGPADKGGQDLDMEHIHILGRGRKRINKG